MKSLILKFKIVLYITIINFTFCWSQSSISSAIIVLEHEPILLNELTIDVDLALFKSKYELGFDSTRSKMSFEMLGGQFKFIDIHDTQIGLRRSCLIEHGNKSIWETPLVLKALDTTMSVDSSIEVTEEFKMIDKHLCRKVILKSITDDKVATLEFFVTNEMISPKFSLPHSEQVLDNYLGVPLEIHFNINNVSIYEYRLKSIQYEVDDSYFELP